jgi:proteasome activator subunit 4
MQRQRQPKPSVPSAEIFVRECRTLAMDLDILGMRGIYHRTRVEELVERFPEWRAERLPGARAFQSIYDKWVPPLSCFGFP